MRLYGRQPLDSQHISVPRGRLFLIPQRCKSCNLCISFCPCGVLRESTSFNGKGYRLPELTPGKEDACVNCQFCSLVCPEFAIYSEEAEA